ncbi:MAG: hypothetical protein KKE11_05045, partial [Gammaproteobacteria bacterium]|nr:hypothetical protein [Gammaproteobacteria bacterium]
ILDNAFAVIASNPDDSNFLSLRGAKRRSNLGRIECFIVLEHYLLFFWIAAPSKQRLARNDRSFLLLQGASELAAQIFVIARSEATKQSSKDKNSLCFCVAPKTERVLYFSGLSRQANNA